MKNAWILVANSSYAQIFSQEQTGKEMKVVHDIENPDGRLKNGEILTDRPGRAFNRLGGARHALGSVVDPHTHEQQIFAKKLATILEKALLTREFETLVIIAPPQFLGELRNSLSEAVKKSIRKEVKKDLPDSLYENDRKESILKYISE
jgi:protein required for attachment to host cells